MPAAAPKARKPDNQAQQLDAIAAELADVGEAATGRLEAVHNALFAEAGGQAIPIESLPALSVLGDEVAIKRARRDALQGHQAVQTFHRTKGAEAKRDAAQKRLDSQGPGLREKIAELSRQLADLEREPAVHQRDVELHAKACEEIRQTAPLFIRRRYRALSAAELTPLRKQVGDLKQEHRLLDVLLRLDPNMQATRHIVEGQRDEYGQRPWLMEDMHKRIVVDPYLWRQHLRDVEAVKRRDELTERTERAAKQLEQAEAQAGRVLDYWRHPAEADEPQ